MKTIHLGCGAWCVWRDATVNLGDDIFQQKFSRMSTERCKHIYICTYKDKKNSFVRSAREFFMLVHLVVSCKNANVKRPNLTFCDQPQYTRFSPAKQVPSIPVSFLGKRHCFELIERMKYSQRDHYY